MFDIQEYYNKSLLFCIVFATVFVELNIEEGMATMKVITLETDDVLRVESFVNMMYRKISSPWQKIFPAWFVIVFDHTKTLRFVPALQSVIKEHGCDARVFSQMAEHRDDWWSVSIVLQPPTAEKFQWALWVRHAEDRVLLGQSILGNAADILWYTHAHLRELWTMACRRVYSNIADTRPRVLFCEAFSEMMYDRRRFFMQHSPAVHLMGDLEKRVLHGTLSVELKRVL